MQSESDLFKELWDNLRETLTKSITDWWLSEFEKYTRKGYDYEELDEALREVTFWDEVDHSRLSNLCRGSLIKSKKDKTDDLSFAELKFKLNEHRLDMLGKDIDSWCLSVRDKYIKKGYSQEEIDAALKAVSSNFEVR